MYAFFMGGNSPPPIFKKLSKTKMRLKIKTKSVQLLERSYQNLNRQTDRQMYREMGG